MLAPPVYHEPYTFSLLYISVGCLTGGCFVTAYMFLFLWIRPDESHVLSPNVVAFGSDNIHPNDSRPRCQDPEIPVQDVQICIPPFYQIRNNRPPGYLNFEIP